MPVNPAEIQKRWEQIRGLPECDLSLAPEAVREYLSEPESAIVKQRILETLIQFANYRVEKGNYHSGNEAAGDLATCEGLETFLVPAVEEAYRFSDFLRKYPSKDRFVEKFHEDLSGLLEKWSKEKPEFSGAPYADMGKVRNAVKPVQRKSFEPFNITETAAMACRIVVHILTLKQRSKDEEEFVQAIGKDFDDNRLLGALSNAVDFLVAAFQKSNTGASDGEKIANAKWGNSEGSGWSWTAGQPGGASGLAPLLFFTAAVVDAFAELDLYLIRPGRANVFADSAPALQKFYQDKQKQLFLLQLGVDMARRWIQTEVLPNLTLGTGQHEEEYPDNSQTKIVYAIQKESDPYRSDWEQAGLKPPVLYYNTLYALQILLWSFGDRSDDGKSVDDAAKSAINRALTLLVYNYDSIPVVKQVLGEVPHVFLLPGRGMFSASDKDSDCDYLDAGFLPLLTRLLVLFVVYGVGDRNLFEPILRDLYVELLQRRHRTEPEYGALWSIDKIEVYSTQRAIQALTFYHAYAAGKELVDRRPGAENASGKGSVYGNTGAQSDVIVLRNKTGIPVFLELVGEAAEQIATTPPSGDLALLFKDKFTDDLGNYLNQRKLPTLIPSEWGPTKKLQDQIQDLLEDVFKAGCAGKLRETAVAGMLIDSLIGLYKEPEADKQRVRTIEFEFLKLLYERATE
jgi:hypothetical protein